MKSQQGFSVLELMVAIVVGAIFLTSAIMISVIVERSMANARNQAVASDIAYRYMRKYVSIADTPSWFNCSTASGSSNTNDALVNPNAQGQLVESGTLTNANSGLPEPISYEVRAIAAYGCSGVNAGTPLLVTSSVTYGSSNERVQQATYESF